MAELQYIQWDRKMMLSDAVVALTTKFRFVFN